MRPSRSDALRFGAQDYVLRPLPHGGALYRTLVNAVARQSWRTRQAHLARRTFAARERTTSVVYHDLGAPLGTIQLCASTLLHDRTRARRVHEMAGLIQRCVAWMHCVIDDLRPSTVDNLLSSAIRADPALSVRREPTSVRAILDTAVAIFAPIARRNAIEFVVECAPHLPRVDADPRRLLQILSNLLDNALKFTPAAGRVVLSARSAEPDASAPDVHRGPIPAVRFAVADSGPGISANDLPHVFQWSWRSPESSRSGLGLGLAIAKGLIHAQGGSLAVDSAPGRGATFWFLLPVQLRMPRRAARCHAAAVTIEPMSRGAQ